jgi:hypothetical protein
MVKEGQREDRGAKGRRRVKTVRKVGRTEVCLHRRREVGGEWGGGGGRRRKEGVKQGRIERRTENEGREEGSTIMKEGETEDKGARKGERKGWGCHL